MQDKKLIENNFDIVITGSGMGGLVCANILSLEGYKVCVLEKNKQIGGCLQSFVHDKVIFDAGVHYVGGLEKGQNLYQVFKYLGILDKLRMRIMDQNAFDKIILDKDEKEYAFAQGYENFIKTLSEDFPGEEIAIRNYCEKIKEVCSKFPLYNLRQKGTYQEKSGVLEIGAKTFIESVTNNKKLQAVLAGNNIIYAGRAETTPFYVHALILNSYIESSWRFVDGGSQIAKLIAKNIRDEGGVISRNFEVKKIEVEDGKVKSVVGANGSRIYGKHFISNLHPVKTLEMTETELIRNVYRKRLEGLENTISCFMLHIVLRKNTFKYFNYNYYYHREGSVWNLTDYKEENWPLGYALFLSSTRGTEEYAEGMTLMTYMKYEEVRPWEDTFNTVSAESDRGDSYRKFKNQKAEILIDRVEEKFPGLRNFIQSYHTATPLSYRDYIGNDDGSLYGIRKDYKDPVKTLISAKTKLPNLYFTGQNLNLHGILGATMSGLQTCTLLLGSEDILEKIKNA